MRGVCAQPRSVTCAAELATPFSTTSAVALAGRVSTGEKRRANCEEGTCCGGERGAVR